MMTMADDHPTGDLAEMTLMAELMKLEAGWFSDRAERDDLARSALESIAILRKHGEFSQGEKKLQEIEMRLRGLLRPAS